MEKIFQLFSCAIVCVALLFIVGCTPTELDKQRSAAVQMGVTQNPNTNSAEQIIVDDTIPGIDSDAVDPN